MLQPQNEWNSWSYWDERVSWGRLERATTRPSAHPRTLYLLARTDRLPQVQAAPERRMKVKPSSGRNTWSVFVWKHVSITCDHFRMGFSGPVFADERLLTGDNQNGELMMVSWPARNSSVIHDVYFLPFFSNLGTRWLSSNPASFGVVPGSWSWCQRPLHTQSLQRRFNILSLVGLE